MVRSEAYKARNDAAREGLSDVDAGRLNSPPTRETIKAETQRLGVEWKEEEIPDSKGGKLHWLGDRSAKTVILYFPGGGFGLPHLPAHPIFWIQTQQKLAAQGKHFSVALLEYSLTPQHKFPTPIRQAVQALNHLLASGHNPEDIIIGGDSAGGNIALGVLSVSNHSHPLIPALKLNKPLRGAMLMSSWVSFQTTSKSFNENLKWDIIPKHCAVGLEQDYRASDDNLKDPFYEPALGGVDWWSGMPVASILNLVGTHEIFLDDIMALGKVLEKAGLNVENVVCENQVHIDAFSDAESDMEPGRMSSATWYWLSKLI